MEATVSKSKKLPITVSPFLTKYNPNEGSFVSDIMREALNTPIPNKSGMKPKPRPSSFPTCSLLLWMGRFRGESLGHYYGQQEFGMEYYTNVGNVLHEKAQFFVGTTGVQFGDWKCVNLKCKKGLAACNTTSAEGRIIKEGKITARDTTNNLCPKCSAPMLYVEKGVEYKGIRGYVDGIWKIPKSMGGGYWIVDYKTTSMRKLEAGKYPEKAHISQLPFYAHVLSSKKYNMDIKGFSLVYMPRDNPASFLEYSEKWTPKWQKVGKKIAKREAENLRVMNDGIESGSYEEAVACKACKSETDYFKKMHGYNECPMLSVCFSERKLTARLDSWVEAHTSGDTPKNVEFREAVRVLSYGEYKGKRKAPKKLVESKKKTKFKPKHTSI